MADVLKLAGFVDAHCHAFQRALRGRSEGADFWAWRESMLELARGQTPDRVRREYAAVYRELRDAGYTAVGEFHYLGLAEAHAAADAARDAGHRARAALRRLRARGLERFRQASVAEYLRGLEELRAAGVRVGVAPHSVRACPRDWLSQLGRYASSTGCRCTSMPTSSRARSRSASPSTACVRSSCSPSTGCLGPRTTVVHATHADGAELDLLAQAAARICACPTTEANLGDGFLPVERVLHRGISLCIGSDSNTRIDPLEELRELDGIGRRQSGRRTSSRSTTLLAIGSSEGAAALGLASWPDVEIDLGHPSSAASPIRARARRRLLCRRRSTVPD